MTVTRKQISEVLHELPDLVSQMDAGELAILVPRLGRALVEAVGITGAFTHIQDYKLYHVYLVPCLQQEVSVKGTNSLVSCPEMKERKTQ